MLGYNFDLYWFDIPLGSFDLGLGYDIFKDKVNNSSENEPRVYLAWSNSTDFSQEKTRDFSEYIYLIEVSDEDKLLASEGITKVKKDSFTDFGNLDLFEIIDVYVFHGQVLTIAPFGVTSSYTPCLFAFVYFIIIQLF